MASWSRAVPARASHFDSWLGGSRQRLELHGSWPPCPLRSHVVPVKGPIQRVHFKWDPSLALRNQVHYINVMLLISPRRLQDVWKDTVSLHWCVTSLPGWDQEWEWHWWRHGDSSRRIIPRGSSPFCAGKGIGAKSPGKTEKKGLISHWGKPRRGEPESLSLHLPISVCKHNEL